MAHKNSIDRALGPFPMAPGAAVEKSRDRSPAEVIADGYMGVVQVATLNAVTQLGMGSLRQCDLKRQEVLAEHPNLEAPIMGLLYNHARLLADIQNSITNNEKKA